GVDVHVIFPTFFLSLELLNPLAELALTRSYNRWLAERTADARDRLRWVIVPPTQTMDRCIAELRHGREHGAAGVMLNGFQHGLYLDDPYYYPLYEEAQELDLVICAHVGTTEHKRTEPIGNLLPTKAALMDHIAPLMKAFWAVLTSDFHERFPR